MQVNPAAQGTAQQAANGNSSLASLANNFDTFLTLLTKQLQYQDPLSPMDSTQFTQQLVGFSTVEQAIASNRKLDQLVSLQTGNQAAAAVSYLGTTIAADSDRLSLINGHADMTYTLPKAAASAQIVILDAGGKPVRGFAAETTMGQHGFTWNGTDNSGVPLPDGVYQMQVSAFDGDEKPIKVTTGTVGKVTGVEVRDGKVFLDIGTLELPFDSLRSVRPSA